MIPWLKCKIFGHKWRVICCFPALHTYVHNDSHRWETQVTYKCLKCKKSRTENIIGNMTDKEKINLVESYEDN